MNKSIIRTDRWGLNPDKTTHQMFVQTVDEYRAFCKALSFVVMGHWVEICAASSPCQFVEQLIHKTESNPSPKHGYFERRFYKFPSYYRRAAIEFVIGQVSSFMTRYRSWQGGTRKRRDADPPRFNPEAGCYPSLYKGQCFKLDSLSLVQVKVWNGSDWVWVDCPIKSVRDRHLLSHSTRLSPALIVRKGKCHLSVPFKLKPIKLKGEPVCAVDIGINTLATCSIVYPDGTVTNRKFIHPGVDIDRRDKQAILIRRAARKTQKLHKGFCSHRYRKARQYNKNIAHQTSRQIVDFAIENGASVIVFERLKGWRPKAGKKKSSLKQRFHGWLHRAVVNLSEDKFKEHGGSVAYVFPRGTSSWAYDGSGKVKRGSKQYELAVFQTGKQYNADLSASYNIAARYFALKFKLFRRKDKQSRRGRSPSRESRIPIVLSDIWNYSKDKMPLMYAIAS
jgi:IS605 OrfB family transposase